MLLYMSVCKYNLSDIFIKCILESLERKFMSAIFNHGNLVWPYNLWFLLLSNESATLEGQPKVSQLTFPHKIEGSNTPWEDP
jgi:hypothetical protein